MQRDLDFVREILLDVAGSNGPLDGRALASGGHGLDDAAYHVKIMIEGGLLEGRVQRSNNHAPLDVQVEG